MILRTLIYASLLVATASNAETLPEKAVETSGKYLYVREKTNNNDAPEIDRWLANIGLPKHQSWCMAYVIGSYEEASGRKGVLPRYGRCSTVWKLTQQNKLRYQTFKADQVAIGAYELQPGDVVIWRHGRVNSATDWNGHTGIILTQQSLKTFKDREGNTMPTNKGNQREGGGVYDRTRSMGFGSTFSVQGFIRVR